MAFEHVDIGDGWVENLVPGSTDLIQRQRTRVRIKLVGELTHNLSARISYGHNRVSGPMEHLSWIPDDRELAVTAAIADAEIALEPWKVHGVGRSDVESRYDAISVTLD